MKKILLFILYVIFLNTTTIVAQNLDIIHKEGCPVIIPTVKTLKVLGKLSETEFSKTMIQYGYHQDNDFSTHKAIAYTNGNLDPIMLKCLNTYYYNIINNSIECVTAIDMIYTTDAITKLVSSIGTLYTVTTNDGYDVFKDKDCLIAIKSDDKFYRIVVSFK